MGRPNKLTDTQVRAAKLETGKRQLDLSDGGNLVLRVTTTNKSWRFPFTFGGKRDSIYIGEYPAITLDGARGKAIEYRNQLRRGENPKQAIARADAEVHAQALADERGAAPTTLGELFDRWKNDYCVHAHTDKGAYIEGIFKRHILTDGMSELRLDLMRPGHMHTIMQRMREKKLAGTTKRVLDSLRQMFKWAAPREWLHRGDPTLGLRAIEFGGKTIKGVRFLEESELVQLAWRLKKSYIVTRWKHACHLILATGTRVEETLLAERDHIDLTRGTWTIPVANQKKTNRDTAPKPHVIHLSAFAKRHLRALLDMPGTSKYVFPAAGRGEAVRFGPANEKTLAHALENLQGVPRSGRRTTTELLLAGGRWSPHDLRRTTSTTMRELGVDSDIIDRCLNHVEPDTIKRTYQLAALKKMMTEAWEKMGKHLDVLTSLPDPEPTYEAPPPKYRITDMTDPKQRQRKAAERLKGQDFGDGDLI